uniref:Uncharacterized protein n=1 Tax=Pseudonaja textilis TaxID=8673 RepID=A0A670Z9U8_PSETE
MLPFDALRGNTVLRDPRCSLNSHLRSFAVFFLPLPALVVPFSLILHEPQILLSRAGVSSSANGVSVFFFEDVSLLIQEASSLLPGW